MSNTYLSVIIPSYNEDKNFARGSLNEVINFLQKQSYTWEVILSDDGSKQEFVDKLVGFAKQDERIIVLKNKHAGKAATVKAGMLAAKGEWRLFSDFDQSTPLEDVNKLLKYAESGFEVIIGSREMIGATREQEPWYRHLMGRVFNLVVQIFTIPGILDTQCGFKLFSAAAAEQLFSKLVVYGADKPKKSAFTGAFDVEVLYLAKKLGFKICEIPVKWQHHETDRVNPLRDSVIMFVDILKIRLADMRGQYHK